MNEDQLLQEMKELKQEINDLKQADIIHEHNLEKLEGANSAAFKWIDELKSLTQTVHNLALSVQSQTSEIARVSEKQSTMQADIMELKLKPAKRWDSIVTAAITGAVGILIGWLFKNAG